MSFALSSTTLVPITAFILGIGALPAETLVIQPEFKKQGLLRNPGMGWELYDDASGEVADADAYWRAQDKIAREHASIFYLRWRWSDVEKRQGVYEWNNPRSNFSRLVDGARDRGLRLAFRFYVNPTDNLRQSTPEWVRKACGDKNGRWIQGKWSPHLDDPTFQKKFANFIAAFGKRFNAPAEVDWIDVSSVGAWGEAHGLVLGNPVNKRAVYEWLLETYADAFDKVLLGMQFGTEFGMDTDILLALEKHDCVLRRDGFGSQWVRGQIEPMQARFPRNPIFAEKCYWNDNETWRNDAQFKDRMHSWADVHRITLEQALECHANTLDLRTVWDAAEWMKTPDLVARFERDGGYRIALNEISAPETIVRGQAWPVQHVWQNHGVGVLPNHNVRWNHKYRVAFGLFNTATQHHVATWIDRKTDPGDWIQCETYRQTFTVPANKTAKLDPGTYSLIAAIVNTTRDGAPHLKLAIENKTTPQGASILGRIEVR